MKPTKIFMTGATGVLGRHIIPQLIEAGHEVGGLTTSTEGANLLRQLNTTPFIGDIFNEEEIDNAIRQFQPDIIIHQVTALKQFNSAQNARIRTIGTQNLVAAAMKYDVKKLISQSIAWSYEATDDLATEKTNLDYLANGPRKITIDGILALENETKKMPDWVILRYGTLYGKETWYGKNGLIYNQFQKNEGTASKGVHSFIHLEDARQLTVDSLNWENGIYNIVDDLPISGKEWCDIYGEKINGQVKLLTEANPWECGVSNQKIKAMGHHLIYPTFREGIEALD